MFFEILRFNIYIPIRVSEECHFYYYSDNGHKLREKLGKKIYTTINNNKNVEILRLFYVRLAQQK